jgi:hypothetical protein
MNEEFLTTKNTKFTKKEKNSKQNFVFFVNFVVIFLFSINVFMEVCYV